MATYSFAKLGKSIKFNPKTWSGYGGDVEVPSLIRSFAQNNPNDNIIIIGKTDLENYSIPEKNIISVQQLYKDKYKIQSSKKIPYTYVYDILKDIKVNGVFIVGGPVGSTNLPNTSYRRKEYEQEGKKIYAKVLETYLNYAAPIIYFLNKSNIPWIHILNDPRYKSIGRDCINIPKICLSQYNEEIIYSHLNNFEEQKIIKEKRQAVYAGVEKMFLLYFKNKKMNFDNKTEKFVIVLNEGNNGVKSRYGELKKFVLDYFDNIKIYGKWEKLTIGNDKRFVGTIPFIELQKILPKVKYTFIIPITSGWVTMKYWEMIVNGIIPFMHPQYDTQNNLNAPEFLRVKSGKELLKKIEYLENNPNEYKKLLNKLINSITEDDYSGKTLSETLKFYANKYKNDYENYNQNKKEFILKHKNKSLF